MADIRAKVCEVLEEIGLPYGYVSKDEGHKQFIAYNITSNKAYKYYDDEEKVTQYKITINIFSVYDFTEIQNKVEKYMQAKKKQKEPNRLLFLIRLLWRIKAVKRKFKVFGGNLNENKEAFAGHGPGDGYGVCPGGLLRRYGRDQ